MTFWIGDLIIKVTSLKAGDPLLKVLLKKAFITGILSGIVLGVFLKVVESFTGIKVYTLLLNVDYIPIIQGFKLHELIEFALHLVISIALAFCLLIFFHSKGWSKNRILYFTILVSIFIGLLLFPTTLLSSRTPSITSFPAWFYWLTGHGLYGWVLGVLMSNRKSD